MAATVDESTPPDIATAMVPADVAVRPSVTRVSTMGCSGISVILMLSDAESIHPL
jgi:hypothetical protein